MKKAVQPDQDPFQGVIIAAITPRRAGETTIDLGAMLELLDFLCETGANAIALLGSTGEFVHFALEQRRHMTVFAAKRSRLPLLVNVSHSTLDGALELAWDAAECGVAGLLLSPPYYFRYSQDAISNFYLDFAAHARSDLPIYLYNIPAFTNEIEISTAIGLLETGMFAGIKDSSGSWEYFMRLRDHATKKPYSILVGNDRLFSQARAAGAQGVVSGVACAVPELMLAIESAVASKEPDRERRVQALDMRLGEFMDCISQFPAPVGIKEAVRQRGINSGATAIDLCGPERQQMEQFLSWFGPWLAVVRKECVIGMRRSGGR